MEENRIKEVITTQEFVERYWLEALFAGILFVFTAAVRYLYRQMKNELNKRVRMSEKESEEQKMLKKGVLAILHDRLYCEGRRLIVKGTATVSEINNIKHIYNGYHALGGNGIGTEIYERCLKLKIEGE